MLIRRTPDTYEKMQALGGMAQLTSADMTQADTLGALGVSE